MPRKYFWFSFSVRDNGHRLGTTWMDERCSKQITLEDRLFLSCDEVSVGLFTPGGSICRKDDIDSGRYSLYGSASLRRYGVDEALVNFENPIPWRLLSNYGEPDDVTYVESGGIVHSASFRWTTKWRENYWVINSGRDDKIRRTRFSFMDSEGRTHHFYAIPWFGPESVDSR